MVWDVTGEKLAAAILRGIQQGYERAAAKLGITVDELQVRVAAQNAADTVEREQLAALADKQPSARVVAIRKSHGHVDGVIDPALPEMFLIMLSTKEDPRTYIAERDNVVVIKRPGAAGDSSQT